mmetsp:Transcript_16142/g.19724  ORF Transcript_16142/g.19724 Transcript_16142/m.19724 type:complete len:344 (-) Transcript_16142:415-1446(-)
MQKAAWFLAITCFQVTWSVCVNSAEAFLHIKPKVNIHRHQRHPFSTELYEGPIKFAGTGERQVDMNQYNLPLDEIEEQWTANVVAKTVDTEGGIFLGVQNDREYFVDIINVSILRSQSSLGIGLQEIAGGRSDGLGITVVSEVVEGGIAQLCGADILSGDSISSISVVRQSQSPQAGKLMDSQETITVKTECLGYDATVDAILSLPEIRSDKETYLIQVKRLRRKPVIEVNLRYPPSQKVKDETIQLFAGENLRLGMLVRGVKLNDPLATRFDTKSEGNCGAGGLCRTCVVGVLRGGELLSPQKVAETQMLQDNPRWRLACKAFVGYGMKEGDITIQVNPKQW